MPEKLGLNEMAEAALATAKEKGWWDADIAARRGDLEIAALIHSEVSEFVEEARKPLEVQMQWAEGTYFAENGKPEGPAIELADAVIRIGDYFASKGWDLEAAVRLKMDYNKTRPHRHGGKRF